MYIARNIRYMRNKHNLTQANLAAKLEKTSAAISDYEKGKSTPPLDVVVRISQFFHISMDNLVLKDLRKIDLLADEGINPSPSNDASDLNQENKYLRRTNALLEQRVTELEREIRENCPDLGNRLNLIN